MMEGGVEWATERTRGANPTHPEGSEPPHPARGVRLSKQLTSSSSLLSLSLCSNQSDWRVENRRGWGFVYKEQKPPVKPEEEEKATE
ncbi:hypothetical protein DPX16_12122 [Anabarilius grahami]|uniref:Uncharacterized protein n=1 Tax=Anabarilius grahami TaxID=495550 RepID=A0A3N0YQL8_ANAGA|nr:hypothetical protein DPX16_12122 [Anabarilius grahami]